MTKYVSLIRVSTKEQGHSGLGLAAQQEMIRSFLQPGDKLVAEFVEVVSGRSIERPQLDAALAAARVHKATILIAKLDRLSRRVSFVAGMIEQGIPLKVVAMPNASTFELHLFSALSQLEAETTSARTKAALAQARLKGKVLGGFRGRHLTPEERQAGVEARQRKADARAHELRSIIDEARSEGATSLSQLVDALNRKGITAPRGGQWQRTQVQRLLARAA